MSRDANSVEYVLRGQLATAERGCDQLRALLRQVRDEMRGYVTLQRTAELADLITASGLLDDEGQQR